MDIREVLPPDAYDDQLLCPSCGLDADGNRYAMCLDGYKCEDTCARRVYGDLCELCA